MHPMFKTADYNAVSSMNNLSRKTASKQNIETECNQRAKTCACIISSKGQETLE